MAGECRDVEIHLSLNSVRSTLNSKGHDATRDCVGGEIKASKGVVGNREELGKMG